MPVVGEPGSGAMFTDPRAELALDTAGLENALWRNEFAPRVALTRTAVARAPGGELRTYPGNHFEIYYGPVREQVMADQTDFLRTHLSSYPGRAS